VLCLRQKVPLRGAAVRELMSTFFDLLREGREAPEAGRAIATACGGVPLRQLQSPASNSLKVRIFGVMI
jgi:hypothetical protein